MKSNLSFVFLLFVLPFAKASENGESHKVVIDPGVTMGEIGLDDLPLKGLTGEQALELLWGRYNNIQFNLFRSLISSKSNKS